MNALELQPFGPWPVWTWVAGFGAGYYRLIDSAGTLTDNGLALGTTPAASAIGSGLAIHSSIAKHPAMPRITTAYCRAWMVPVGRRAAPEVA